MITGTGEITSVLTNGEKNGDEVDYDDVDQNDGDQRR